MDRDQALDYMKNNKGKIAVGSISMPLTVNEKGENYGGENFHAVGMYYNPYSEKVMVLDPAYKLKAQEQPGSEKYYEQKIQNYAMSSWPPKEENNGNYDTKHEHYNDVRVGGTFMKVTE